MDAQNLPNHAEAVDAVMRPSAKAPKSIVAKGRINKEEVRGV